MNIHHFFDPDTATFTYIVIDSETKQCAVIDPVLNYDHFSGTTTSQSIDQVVDFVRRHQLEVVWILETHCHADHLTGAQRLKAQVGGTIGIGEHILPILEHWVPVFNTAADTPLDGSQFDHLFKDGETFHIGSLKVEVLHTPGHTPACLSYLVEDALFVGDTLFMPDVGTARTDFPGGSAEVLYTSIQKILALPEETKIYTCHDYPPAGRDIQCVSTVAQQKAHNIMVHDGVDQAAYVHARNNRDQGKAVPRLLLPSLQVNLRAGGLGEVENNQIRYIKIPLDQL